MKIRNCYSAYEAFFNKFNSLHDKIFEKFVVTVKSKLLINPWIAKGILKSGKGKQRLCDEFLTLFRMGIFGAAHGWGSKKAPLPKICQRYPTMIKLGTVIP